QSRSPRCAARAIGNARDREQVSGDDDEAKQREDFFFPKKKPCAGNGQEQNRRINKWRTAGTEENAQQIFKKRSAEPLARVTKVQKRSESDVIEPKQKSDSDNDDQRRSDCRARLFPSGDRPDRQRENICWPKQDRQRERDAAVVRFLVRHQTQTRDQERAGADFGK